MTDTINDKKPGLFDYPEPSEDFNNKITEKQFEAHPSKIFNTRPKPREWFRCYDPGSEGKLESIRRAIVIQLDVKNQEQDFICFGDEDFYEQIKQDIGQVQVRRPAMYETASGRTGVWFVKKQLQMTMEIRMPGMQQRMKS